MATKNNYLIITEKGRIHEYLENNFAAALSKYIKEKLGFATGGFKLPEETWNTISNNYNEENAETIVTANIDRINLFNAICTVSNYKIKKVIWQYSSIFPESKTWPNGYS